MAVDNEILAKLKVQNGASFKRELAGDAAAVRSVGAAAKATGRDLDESNRRSLLYSQGLYTLRRGLYATTIGLGTLAGGAALMGLRFDATMEQNQISMSHFLGSTTAAKTELSTLFDLAEKTPFTFPQITSAATKLLAFQFGLRDTNQWLRTIGDTAAGLGGGADTIDRLVLALGQIKAKGRLQGDELLQLQELGLNPAALLGLTTAQTQALYSGQLQLPANRVLPALQQALARKYGGLSAQQAQSGLGLLSSAKDLVAQLAGQLNLGLFKALEGRGPKAIRILSDMRKQLLPVGQGGAGGGVLGMVRVLDEGLGANGRLVTAFNELRDAGTSLVTITTQAVIPAFLALWATLGVGSPPFRLLVWFLGQAASHTTLLKIALIALIGRAVVIRAATLAWALSTRIAGTELAVLTAETKLARAAEQAYTLWTLRAQIATTALGRTVRGLSASLLALRTLGPVAVLITLGIEAGHGKPHGPKWLRDALFYPLHLIPKSLGGRGDFLDRFASGGRSLGGPAIVGEHGAELVNLPRGAQVLNAPGTANTLDRLADAILRRPMVTVLEIDGREVARGVARYTDGIIGPAVLKFVQDGQVG